MKIYLIAAKAKNGVIGNGPNIPWSVRGEQLIFKAFTQSQWILVGRKTFESMGVLENRKYAVVSRSTNQPDTENVRFFSSIGVALEEMRKFTDVLFIAGGGEIYTQTIKIADALHISTIDIDAVGEVFFPEIPPCFTKVYDQEFSSNIDYTYSLFKKC